MKGAGGILVALLVAACGGAPAGFEPAGLPAADAAPALDALVAPDQGEAAATTDAGADARQEAATADAGAAHEGGDGGAPEGATGGDAGPDAAPARDGGVEGGSTPDATPPASDGGLVTPCTASAATCAAAERANAAIRTTFAGVTCTTSDPLVCAGVRQDGVTETLPALCRDGRLALAWCGTVPCYECSRGCAAGRTCAP